MRSWIWLGVALVVVTLWAGGSQAGMIGPSLQGYLSKAAPGQKLPVIVALKQQADNAALERACADKNKEERWGYVVSELKRLSETTQRDLLTYLASEERAGKAVKVNGFWIVNAVYCEATPEVIQALVARPEVYFADYDLIYSPNILNLDKTGRVTGAGSEKPPRVNLREWNVTIVGADSVWRLMGNYGEGVIVGEIDTGMNYLHWDLRNHLWTSAQYPNPGWNFESGNNDPMDIQGHGTHVAGTVSSDGSAGDTCGMAPRARNMICRVRTQADSIAENQVWAAQQFCVAPPLDPTNHAQLITMSLGWVYAWTPRLGLWRQSVTNVATAGLPFQIAAGNEGSGNTPYNLRVPGSCPGPWRHPAEAAGGRGGAISIGATDNADAIASFSSQGPVTWDTVAGYNDYPYPPGLLKPDVSAPGVNITSCAYNNVQGYASGWSGTSMATPCVSGVVALMLKKNPNLLPWQVDSILQMTVRPLGTQPKNNTFGTGRISAYKAVQNTPLPGPQHDISIQSIQTPGVKVDPLVAIAPQVRVTNTGTYDETNVPVRFRVDSAGTQVYLNLQTIPTLDSAATVTVTFANWTPGPGGNTYNLMTYHSYSPDTNRSNDTLKAVTQTRVHDVRSISSSIGSRVRASSPVAPQLTLGSADYTERAFNATCWIDSGATRIYTQTVAVDSVVASGTKTVAFPVWNTGPVGATYNLTFFHTFADPIRSNDTLRVATQASNAIRVAIENASASRGRTPPNAIYQIDSLCLSYAWVDSIVAGTSLDLSNYDVLVTGDVGYTDNDFAAYQRALLDWVRSGKGVVILGWGVFGISNGPGAYSPMDTVCALMCATNYSFLTTGTVHVTDTTHPITRGVRDFNVYGHGESANSGLWAGAVSLGNYSAQPTWSSIAYKYLGTGRSVYLGPIYFADFGSYNNEPYYTDPNSRLLLKQAIEWAAMGSVSGTEILPPLTNQPRSFALAQARPNPLRGTTEINYQLPTASQVRITVFNVAGQAVRTLVDAKEDAGYKSVTWNGRNDRGVRVGAGVYLYRMEAGSFTATRKMVVVK